LPNRDQFLDQLTGAIDAAAKDGSACAVLMLDLDRFKHVNDVLGHSFGDALLREVAHRLESVLLRRGDSVARLGGDEFAVLLRGQDITQARVIAERLRQALEVPMQVERQAIDMSAGIGVAAYPEHADNAELLLSRVEIAMYTAKLRHVGVMLYDATIDQKSQDTLSMLSELRRAVEGDELVLYFQPKLALADGAITGVETLVRWVHPQRGFVPPGDFIPFAEQTGFITDITQWVMRKSVQQAARWQAEGLDLSIAVNLSTRDLMDIELPQRFAEMLARERVEAGRFCLEITESAIMDDPQRALSTLDRLHAMGFRLSIDDFGTGYSSLAYLKRLPVDELKIDRSFVSGVETDRDDAVIVRSTIDLGHNMGLKVVAEGIENEAIWRHLRAAGCDVGQGYFMSKPIPATQLAEWMAKWQPPHAEDMAARPARQLYAVS
jgi:diguanylate cyclase (GGDEF)-like protein